MVLGFVARAAARKIATKAAAKVRAAPRVVWETCYERTMQLGKVRQSRNPDRRG
ncbi:MAG: hypothetical protein Q9199_001893, partial [Rusavskia elegans]